MLVRLRLFFSSFIPLFVISGIRFESGLGMITSFTLALVGLASLWSLVRASKKTTSRTVTPLEVHDLGAEAAAYVAAYIIPFVAVPQPDAGDVVTFAMVLAVIAAVYVQSDLIGVNPVLYLFGLRVFRVEGVRRSLEGSRLPTIMIGRSRPEVGRAVRVIDLSPGVVLVGNNDDS